MNPARGRKGFFVQFYGSCSVLKTEPESRWSKNFFESAAYERQNSENCSEVFSDYTYMVVSNGIDSSSERVMF